AQRAAADQATRSGAADNRQPLLPCCRCAPNLSKMLRPFHWLVRQFMTYCVGMLLDSGLVFLADSRTNAGVDQISTFRKISVFERPGDRVMVLMSAGNLALSQSVVNILRERNEDPEATGIHTA